MGHNISARKRAADARAATLTAFLDWTLSAGCVPCGRGSWVEVRVLVAVVPGHTVGAVLHRLRCQRCGRTPTVVWLGNRMGTTLTLLGPGSY